MMLNIQALCRGKLVSQAREPLAAKGVLSIPEPTSLPQQVLSGLYVKFFR